MDTRTVGLALGLLLGAGVACAQTQNCTMTGTDGKTVTIPGCNASPAQKFPYPGDSTPAAPADQTPAAPTTTPAPAVPDTAPASKRFPYPGETDAPAAPAAASSETGNAGGLKDAGSSGTNSDSSSSSSSSSLGDAGLPPDDGPLSGEDDAAKARRARRKLPPVARQSPTEREEEDIRVAGFYQNDGNYRGAYLRGKDAVSIAATDPDAHFVLAEAARKLGKLDEALDNYKQCLKLDPIAKEKKAAEKALKEMQGGGA